jgi:cell division protein FtsI/penicillin-binding protein 2
MGHEVAVNAMQLTQMISVVANGGFLVRPWTIREIRDPSSGALVKAFKPKRVRRVVTPETAAELQQILARVVQTGTGKQAQVAGFQAAGKTGTAQKLEANGIYSHSKFTASFIGFIPAERPRLSIVVIIDEPIFPYYGGVVAAPIFKRTAADTLAYLGPQNET